MIWALSGAWRNVFRIVFGRARRGGNTLVYPKSVSPHFLSFLFPSNDPPDLVRSLTAFIALASRSRLLGTNNMHSHHPRTLRSSRRTAAVLVRVLTISEQQFFVSTYVLPTPAKANIATTTATITILSLYRHAELIGRRFIITWDGHEIGIGVKGGQVRLCVNFRLFFNHC